MMFIPFLESLMVWMNIPLYSMERRVMFHNTCMRMNAVGYCYAFDESKYVEVMLILFNHILTLLRLSPFSQLSPSPDIAFT